MRRLILAALILCSCSHSENTPTESPQSVKCTTAKLISFEQRDFAALTTADDAVNLAFKISGFNPFLSIKS